MRWDTYTRQQICQTVANIAGMQGYQKSTRREIDSLLELLDRHRRSTSKKKAARNRRAKADFWQSSTTKAKVNP